MILRRFTKHVTDQNWFAVGLDVIVVITGIFLGMQVTEWNETRKENTLQQIYKNRLVRDIENDMSNAQARLHYFTIVKSYGEKALAYLDLPQTDRKPTPDILIAFMLASSRWENFYSQVTYDELKNTGRIHLIGDVDARDLVANYYAVSNIRLKEITSSTLYFKQIRSIIQPEMQEEILHECEEVGEIIQSSLTIDESCSVDLDIEVVTEHMHQIESHPSIKAELIYAISQLRYNTSIFREQTVAADEVLSLLSRRN